VTRGEPAAPLLVRLLQAAGYRVSVHGDATLAVRVHDRRGVVLAPAQRSPAELDALLPGDAAHRTVVYDDDPGPVARAMAAERGIEVLDPSALGPALGELLLRPASPADDGGGAGPTLETPFAILPEGARVVRPRIGREEAEALAGLDPRRVTLRLMPFFVAPYRVRPTTAHGAAGAVLDRTVVVDAVARRAEVWESGDRELVPGVEEPHQVVTPAIGATEAAGLALEAIRRHHTVHVDHTEQHGGALVIETRRVPPSPDDVRIGPLELIYVPHWYVEGTDGRVVLDAVTGLRVGLAALPG
jgi:hypothetical protein